MAVFVKTVNGFAPVTIFAKRSILDVRLGFEYVSKTVPNSFTKFTEKFLEGLLSFFLISVMVNTCSWEFCVFFAGQLLCRTPAELTFACSKSTIETREKGVNYVPS